MATTQTQYERYFDRSVRTKVTIRPVRMFYVYTALDSTLKEAERTLDAVCSNLIPKTTGPYQFIAATSDTVTIKKGVIHNTISIDRATVSPSIFHHRTWNRSTNTVQCAVQIYSDE